MVEECFVRGEQQEAERRCPRNLQSCRDGRPPRGCPMGGEVLAEDQNVVHVDKTERKLPQERWNVFPAFQSPKGMYRNSKIPNGVMMAVFWMSSKAMETW